MSHVHHGQTLFFCDLGATTITEVLYPPWMEVESHTHGVPHLALVFAGELAETGEGRSGRAGPGWALFRPAGYRHTNTFFHAETRGVIFELRQPPAALQSLMARVEGTASSTSPALRRISGKMRRELSSSDAASPVALEGLLFELAAAFFRSLPDEEKSGSALSRARRIEQARLLLRESGQSLSSIAADCGFYDQAHFTRAFKSATGFTPLVYRRNQEMRSR